MGVNYYPRFSKGRIDVAASSPRFPAGAAGLRGARRALLRALSGLPIVITETSLVGTPEEKIDWLRRRPPNSQPSARGHDIAGYTWFPFFTLVDRLYRFDQKQPDEWFMEFGLVDLVRGADRAWNA